jgi:hypothetical protein
MLTNNVTLAQIWGEIWRRSTKLQRGKKGTKVTPKKSGGPKSNNGDALEAKL